MPTENKQHRWTYFDHLKFGVSMSVLGMISAIVFLSVVDGSKAVKFALAAGLTVWLGPLIFVGWCRVYEKVFFHGLMIPLWHKVGLIK